MPFFSLPNYNLSFSFKLHLKTLNHTNPKHNLFSCLCLVERSFFLCSTLDRVESDHLFWNLATLTREKCSALARSCYIPSRTTCLDDDISKSNTKGEDGFAFRGGGRRRRKQLPPTRHSGRSCTAVSMEPCRLKSNLKIKAESEVEKRLEQRKVSWPDAHGKDIAHVQEFELSASEDGEYAGNSKRKYCGVCTIQ